MKLKLFLVVFIIAISCSAGAQICGTSLPMVSVYTRLNARATHSIGTEAGWIGDESRFGYYAGAYYEANKLTLLKPKKPVYHPALVQQPVDLTKKEYVRRDDLTIYFKGSYRILRTEKSHSLFAIVSPEINLSGEADLKAGFRTLLPVSNRLAISVEPLYSVRQKNVTVNLGLSVVF